MLRYEYLTLTLIVSSLRVFACLQLSYRRPPIVWLGNRRHRGLTDPGQALHGYI